jgi:hypothetical protein
MITPDLWLTILQLSSAGCVVLIWLVQLVIYPAFHVIERHAFVAWHLRYTGAVTWVVAPLLLLQAVGMVAVVWYGCAPMWVWWAAAGGIALAWTATASWSVPAHNRLQRSGQDWVRTAAWTAVLPMVLLLRPA